MKRLRNKNGFSFIELVIAMAIMGILGAMVIGLIRTGLTSSKRINKDTAYETEARAALSLITVQLRRHDATGAIYVDEERKKIELRTDPGAPAPDNGKGMVITYENGVVYAKETDDVSAPLITEGLEPIATVNDVDVHLSVTESAVAYEIVIKYGEPGNLKELRQTVTQRSNPVSG